MPEKCWADGENARRGRLFRVGIGGLPAAGRKIKYLRGRRSMKRRESQQLGELQQTAKDFVGAMKRALADEDQFYRYVYGGKGDQPPTEVTLRKADSKAMKEMAATLREMTGVVRDLYGMPAPAAEGAKKAKDEDEPQSGVILLG